MCIVSGTCFEIIEAHEEDVNVSSLAYADEIKYRLSDPESWCTARSDRKNWIQLTFPSIHGVWGFSLGGNTNTTTLSFVKKFRVFSKLLPWGNWTPVVIDNIGKVVSVLV